jgi:hypothetical protein
MVDIKINKTINEVMPDRLLSMVGVRPKNVGPNCWNSTICFFDANYPIKFTDDYEIMEWLKTHTEKLERNESPQLGDILVMYGEYNSFPYHDPFSLQHTAVYLGDGLYWNKSGMTNRNPWEICTFEDIDRYYNYCTEIYYVRVKEESLIEFISNAA